MSRVVAGSLALLLLLGGAGGGQASPGQSEGPLLAVRNPERAFIVAERAYIEQRWDRAIQLLNQLIAEHPDHERHERMLYYLGESYHQLGDHSASRRTFEVLTARYPESYWVTHAQLRIGNALLRNRRYDEARQRFQTVTTAPDPDPAERDEAQRLIVESYQEQGQLVQALRELEPLIAERDVLVRDRGTQDSLLRDISEAELTQLSEQNQGNWLGGACSWELLRRAGLTDDREADDPRLDAFDLAYGEHPLRDEVAALRFRPVRVDNSDVTRIGLLLPSTGRFEQPSEKLRLAIQVAGDRVRREGISPPTVVLGDTAGDPARAVAEIDRLVNQERVSAIIGPLLTDTVGPAVERAQELGVPIVALSRKAGVPETGPMVFRNMMTPAQQGALIAEHLLDRRQIRTVALLYPNSRFGAERAHAWWTAFERAGGSVVYVGAYDGDNHMEAAQLLSGERRASQDDADLPYLRRDPPQFEEGRSVQVHAGHDYQAILVADGYRQIVRLAPALIHQEISLGGYFARERPVTLVTGWSGNHPDLVRLGQDYVRRSEIVDGFFAGADDDAVAELSEAFEARFEEPPTLLEACAYDDFYLLAHLLENHEGGRRALAERIRTARMRASMSGLTSFTQEGEGQRRSLVISYDDIEDGLEVVWPID